MIFAFPYHDPTGVYNKAFRNNFSLLKKHFSVICTSATNSTIRQNQNFIGELEKEGFFVYKNSPLSTIGDHSRQGLQMALKTAKRGEPIFFSFIDRILFALETGLEKDFLENLEKNRNAEFLIFERSNQAWSTHPDNYRKAESVLTQTADLLFHRKLDLMPCGLLFSKKTAGRIFPESISDSWDVWAEWILLALKMNIPSTIQQVDWLAWEDPFWENIKPEILKKQRENSFEETLKRVRNNLPVLSLLTEERFANAKRRG